MLRRILVVLLFIVILICGYGIITIRRTLPIEIIPPAEEQSAGEATGAETAAEGETAPQEPTAEPTPTPTPGPTPTPAYFLSRFSTGPTVVVDEAGSTYELLAENELRATRALPRHGLIIAFILPLLVFGVPWLIMEIFIVRYIQPRGEDLTTVLVKAKDGLFVNAVVSMTARRTLTLASTRMTWPRVRNFVEKTVEQELIHEAIQFQSLDELEQNIKTITERLLELSIVEELSRDFGVEVLRFNIEIRYTAETREALQRKAEASAGGIAYLAYAAAAHLDPDQPESRELYRIFQETSSQVDAARSLGGGIKDLISAFSQRGRDKVEREETDSQ